MNMTRDLGSWHLPDMTWPYVLRWPLMWMIKHVEPSMHFGKKQGFLDSKCKMILNVPVGVNLMKLLDYDM